MKYAIVIPDGAADVPLEGLDGRTPLQAARTPHLDWIAPTGKRGTVRTVPRNMECGSDVDILSVLGYDPREYYTGRAPLEAAAQGLHVGEQEWVFRCNFVTIIDGVMEDQIGDLGVETAKDYRRRGYAKTAVSAVVSHFTTRGGEAFYTCSPENVASIATARSVGSLPFGRSLILAAPAPQ